MTIVTRQRNATLYRMMQNCLEGRHTFVPYTRFGKAKGSIDYLHAIVTQQTGWVVNLDEDCFITDQGALERLIEFMQQHKYDYCGMPDGGITPHRTRNWQCMNPFFNVFNLDVIQPLYVEYTRKQIDTCVEPYMLPPDIVNPAYVTRDRTEPFCGFFYWLLTHTRPLFLDAQMHGDGTSTILLDHRRQPFAYHAWYSRLFGHDQDHTQRTMLLYHQARGLL